MKGAFQATRISEHVWWVGAIDWGIRDFHGYSTHRGSTYNAYLIVGDRVTLIDTVKRPFLEEMMARIASVVEPEKIDTIVSNHAEMDHSGSLPDTLARIQPERVFASTMGVKALRDHFHLDRGITALKDGETLDLGGLDLTVLETRMLHWPDSMMTYLGADELLFSQDGFGMHLATSTRFADEIREEILYEEAAKYYANILLPYSPLIRKLLDRVRDLGVPFSVIAPDHGPIWRKDLEKLPQWYALWAEQAPAEKAVIVFDTMWQSTALMARAVHEGLAEGGVESRLMPLGASHRSDVATEILDAGALLVGSPTINNQMFPTVADVLCYLKGLKPQNLVGQAFGSFGWSGEAVGLVKAELDAMKIEPVGEPIKVKYVPDEDALRACRALGSQTAAALKEKSHGL